MESSKYQNVPNTIQNIFLNQSLESRVIKDTIIDSMALATSSYDLAVWRNETRRFRDEYEDVRKWYHKDKNGKIKVMEDASRVKACHTAYSSNKRLVDERSAELVYAQKRDTALLPEIQKQTLDTAAELDRQTRLRNEKQKKYDDERDRHNRKVGELEKVLEDTKKRRKHWKDSDIETIIKLQGLKAGMDVEVAALRKEYDTLMGSNTDIKAKYEQLTKDAEQKMKDLLQEAGMREIALEQEFLQRKSSLMEASDKARRQLSERISAETAETSAKKEELQENLKNLELQKMRTATMDPNDGKVKTAEEKIKKLEDRSHELSLKAERIKAEEDKKTNATESQIKARQTESEKARDEMRRRLETLDKARQDIQSLLDRQKGSLVEWLAANVEDWQNTLGKALDEDAVLYNTSLSPRMSSKEGSALMGVEIDFSQIDREVRTPQQLRDEFSLTETHMAEVKDLIQDNELKLSADIDGIKKKAAPELRSLRKQRAEAEAELSTIPSRTEALKSEIRELQDKTVEWRAEQIKVISEESDKVRKDIYELKEKEQAIETRRQREEKAIGREFDKGVKEAQALRDTEKKKLADLKNKHREDFDSQKRRLDAQMDAELQGKGVDSKALQTLRDSIKAIDDKLDFLQQHQSDFYDWQRDKKELFDHEEERAGELKDVRKKLAEQKARFDEHTRKLDSGIAALGKKKRELEDRHTSLEKGLRSVEDFWASNLRDLPQPDELKEAVTTDETQKILESLRDGIYSLQGHYEDFKRSVDLFTANFSKNNTFHFRTDLDTESDYVDFAINLQDFVSMRIMDTQRSRTTAYYSQVLQEIAQTMHDLMRGNSQVQKTINDINRDFLENNFTGVIKDIQLRMVQSNDPLTTMALNITEFVDEADLNLGELNLFSDMEQRESNNLKAVRYINALIDQLEADPKREQITLADTFKLEFKVKENDNDTSWVEKLSNVGSDGTDILVKAMVNIMLINVFKRKESKKFGDFRLHCMMDEIGKLHPNNVRGILEFANKRNIFLINSSPMTYNASEYRYTYTLSKNDSSNTEVKTLLTVR